MNLRRQAGGGVIASCLITGYKTSEKCHQVTYLCIHTVHIHVHVHVCVL